MIPRLFQLGTLAAIVFMHAPVWAQTRIAPVATEQYYSDAGLEQAWSDENYTALLSAIEGLADHGLNPEHYGYARLVALREDVEARDRLATSAWLAAASHLLYGKLDPISVEPSWTVAARQADFATVLSYALSTGTVAESLDGFAPRQPIYRLMKAELARLREDLADGTLQVSEGPVLKSGDTGVRVSELQSRLVELGMLAEDSVTGRMDEPTLTAVETFQSSEGLDADGVVGAATLRALNRGPQARIDQVRVNMERFRWLPDDLGRRHLRANIASFDVTAFEDGTPQRTHLTIVGKPYRSTPVFSDQIEYIIFNPWWETPPSLARSDKLPLFQRDPGAVERLGFQVLDSSGAQVSPASIDWNSLTRTNFPYRLRQAPGPLNALGEVKIMFPNPHNVYIHDTPTRGLFSQRQRAFSSGCLRTQDPVELAKWLLEETPDWTPVRVDAAVSSGRETRANLASPVPVHILYLTVVSDETGGVRYLDDIYQRDGAVLAGLRATPS